MDSKSAERLDGLSDRPEPEVDTEISQCPKCGTPVPGGSTSGSPCPRCLIGMALEFEASSVGCETSAEAEPVVVGPYRILEPLGEGGMGVVYLAQQTEPVRRRVALKVIKAGLETREVLARFEAERQALALMDHPNIAMVLDGGRTEIGRPYFVMELVRGEPITRYAERHRLSLRERLELFIPVCEAVQHAHHKGVIHRDLKPTNILVTVVNDRPIPKVIDFGIAKATSFRLTERTVFTRRGQLIGTPEYMSPEQAETDGSDVDTRTDVYALGAILYELLAGLPPFLRSTFQRAGYDEIRKVLRESEPPPPSVRAGPSSLRAAAGRTPRGLGPRAMRRELRGDLDWIVLKAISKDRTRRYDTANALAQDIARYLRNEPVVAGPPSSLYRLRKLAKRNRIAIGISAAILFGILGASVGLAAALVESSRQRAKIETALNGTERARQESEAVTAFLAGMLSQVDPSEKGREVAVREVLDEAAATIGERLEARPLVEARLRRTIGRSYQALGHYEQAESQYSRALAIEESRLGADSPEAAGLMSDVGIVLGMQGRYGEAEPLFERALDIRRRTLGNEHPTTLDAMTNLGVLYKRQQRFDEAARLYVEALERRRRVVGEDDPNTLTCANNLAVLYYTLARYREAAPLYEEVLAAQRRLLGDEHPSTLVSVSNLAMLYEKLGRHDEAGALLVGALETARAVLGDDHPDTLTPMNNLARVRASQGRLDEAEELQIRALEGGKKALHDRHPRVLAYMGNLADVYRRQGRYDDAEPLFLRTLALRREVLGEEHSDTLRTAGLLGAVYIAQGKPETAVPLLTETATTAGRTLPADHPLLGDLLKRLGIAFRALGRYAEAEAALLEAHGMYERKLGREHERTIGAVGEIAELYEARGDAVRAAEWRLR